MVYGTYNYSYWGLINQLITGGPHIVDIPMIFPAKELAQLRLRLYLLGRDFPRKCSLIIAIFLPKR